MNAKQPHFPVFKRLTITLVSLCGFLFFSSTHAFIGEDIDLNLYKQIDKGHVTFYQKTVSFYLKKSAEKLNKLNNCKEIFGVNECFDPYTDFTTAELETIKLGGIGPIVQHLKPELKTQLTTENIEKLRSSINQFYDEILKGSASTVEKVGKLGYTGLFSDGSLDNSSYDIMYDIEQINRVIFTEEIPYEGEENNVSGGMIGLLSGLYDTPNSGLQNTLSPYSPTNTGTTITGTTTPNTNSGTTSSSGILAVNACNPSDLANLDSGLYTDINNQISTGGNGGSSSTSLGQGTGTGGQVNTPGNGNSNNGNGVKTRTNSLTDGFPCNTFFCIRVNFLIYQQKVFGNTKTFTVESVLDKNLKIADKYAGNSLTQSKMTRIIFGLDLKNLNLPGQVHMGVVVTSLPIPLLNVPKGGTKGASDGVNMKDEFKDETLLNRAFQKYGLDYKRQNDLAIFKNALGREIIGTAELTTGDVNAKLDKIETTGEFENYPAALSQGLQTDYYESFNNDLLALDGFTANLVGTLKNPDKEGMIDKIISVIRKMYGIPKASK